MNPDIDALWALLARVEACTGPDRDIDQDLFCDLGLCPRGEDGFFDAYRAPRYTDSLDAAVALVERLLPGWPTILTTMPAAKPPSRYVAKVIFVPPEEKAWGVHHKAGGASMPLAIVAALLRAFVAQAFIAQAEAPAAR